MVPRITNPKFFQSQLQTFKTQVQTWWGWGGGCEEMGDGGDNLSPNLIFPYTGGGGGVGDILS